MSQSLDPNRAEDTRSLPSLRDRQLRTLFETTLDAIALVDDQGRYLDVNPAACQLFCLEPDQLLGRCFSEFTEPGYNFQPAWQQFQHSEKMRGEFHLLRANGESRIVEYAVTANFWPHRHLCVMRDLTERKKAEKQVQELTRQLEQTQANQRATDLKPALSAPPAEDCSLEQIARHIPGMMYQFRMRPDGTSHFPYASEGLQDIYGFTPQEVQEDASKIFTVIHTEDIERVTQSILASAENLTPWYCEYRVNLPDGRLLWLLTHATPQREPDGSTLWHGYIQDISDRKQVEEHLRNSSKNLSEIKFALDQVAIVAITDERGIINYASDNFCKISKYSREELIGQNHRLINSGYHPQEFFRHLWRTISRGKIWQGEIKNRAKDGTYYWVDTTILPLLDENGKPSQYLSIRLDISKRKRQEQALRQSEIQLRQQTEELEITLKKLQKTQIQLIQAEKMSSLGQLVAGIAHEINNPVNFIYGNLKHATDYVNSLKELISLYQKHYPSPPQAISEWAEEIELEELVKDFYKLIQSMRTGATRLHEIVKSLRIFSRLDESDLKATDLHENIESTLVLLQNRLNGRAGKPEIHLSKNYGNLPLIECYGGLLNQVFMNLFINAIEAIEQKREGLKPGEQVNDRGKITITTSISSENWVLLSIEDNGCGMSPEVQAKIFNPFFTNKPIGKGMGMGLATSYQIITENHQGSLQCFSTLGEGTEFVITFPLQSALPKQHGSPEQVGRTCSPVEP
jgi:two-component system NtrC family sensor kinase